ncbi:MAG: hypothetical protein HC874_27535 [Richelia sp. SL_2_1]|nr:hypothetical protein [Richelia sp. SL_2_1]
MNDEQLLRTLSFLYNNIKSDAYSIDETIPMDYLIYFSPKGNRNIITRENTKVVIGIITRNLLKMQVLLKVEPYLTKIEK